MSMQQCKHNLARVWPAVGAMALLAAGLAGGAGALAADAPAAATATNKSAAVAVADETVVLDGTNLWRYFTVSEASHLRQADGSLVRAEIDWEGHPARRGETLLGWDPVNSSPLPPAGWADPDFDDSAWPRVRLPQPALPSVGPSGGARGGCCEMWRHFDTVLACLRGEFEVRNPSTVKSIRLSLDYWGGVVVYVNGKEATRGHVRAGQTNLADTVADDYPQEAWTQPNGKPLGLWGHPPPPEKYKDRMALRNRRLNEVVIPPALLRQGANVLSLELHAAPFHCKAVWPGEAPGWEPAWPPIGVSAVRLTVSPAGAAISSRPSGIRVWGVTRDRPLVVYTAVKM